MIFESPWAITKKKPKPKQAIDPVEAIMKNRAKQGQAEEGPKAKKKRKERESVDEDLPVGNKKKRQKATVLGIVAESSKSGKGDESEPNKKDKKKKALSAKAAGSHASANLSTDDAARRPAHLPSAGDYVPENFLQSHITVDAESNWQNIPMYSHKQNVATRFEGGTCLIRADTCC